MNTAHTSMILEAAAALSRRVIQVRDGYSSGNDEARAGLWKRMHEANMEYLNAVHYQSEPFNVAIDAAGAIQHAVTVSRPDPSRAEMAMAMMAALAPLHDKFHNHDTAANIAVAMADALIAALARKEKQ
jgi:hypothetical protein